MTASGSRQEIYRRGADAPAGGLLAVGGILAVVGLGLFVMGLMGQDPGRAWRVFHINFLFFTALSTGALIFAAVQKVTKGVWAGPIIRFAEGTVAFLPVSLICFLVLFLGREHVFPWISHPTPVRGSWLTVGWVFWRDLAALLIVFTVAIVFVWHDLKPDVADLKAQATGWRRSLYERIAGNYSATPEHSTRNDDRLNRIAPLFILLYGYLFSLLGFDLIMSLAPFWVSNLFGAFFFIGGFLSGLTTLGLLMVYWRGKLGAQSLIGTQQFHDLGKLIFGFSVFWAYLMFSQVLVIWYGNLHEETAFPFYILWGSWRPISVLVGLMVFLVPFWGLIWVKAKITPVTFVLFALISWFGMWLERYLMVQPSLTETGPAFGLPEFGVTAGFLGLFLLSYGLFANTFPMVSPRLAEKAQRAHH